MTGRQWVWLGAAALSAAMHIGYQLALQRGYAEGDLNVSTQSPAGPVRC